jgi:hypothetical protein
MEKMECYHQWTTGDDRDLRYFEADCDDDDNNIACVGSIRRQNALGLYIN